MRKTRKNRQKTPGKEMVAVPAKHPSTPPLEKRAKADPTMESEQAFKNRMEVKVKIPEELQSWLVEDLVTKQKQRFQLPAKNIMLF